MCMVRDPTRAVSNLVSASHCCDTRCPELRWKVQRVIAPPDPAGQKLITRFKETPPTLINFLVPSHIGAENNPVFVACQEPKGRLGLAPEFIIPGCDVEVEIRKAVQNLPQRSQIVALVAQMAGNETGIGMAFQQAIAMPQQFFIGGNILAVEIEGLKIRGPLLIGSQGLPAGGMIGDMGVDGNLQLSTLLPEQVEPWIVGMKSLIAR